MIIIGAKGHALEILDILEKNEFKESFEFFDDVNPIEDIVIASAYNVITSFKEVKQRFTKDTRFIIGIGDPLLRHKMSKSFSRIGGSLNSIISKSASIGNHDVSLGRGVNIMNNVFISNSVEIGEGALINSGVNIHHDCKIGKYSELSPKSLILGRVELGDFCQIGAGAIILPKIHLGQHVVVGAGAVVTRDVKDYSRVKGIPAKAY